MSSAIEEESSRRSRTRDEILLGLGRAKEATLGQLADLTGIGIGQLGRAMFGNDRHFRRDLSPVNLGQVTVVGAGRDRVFKITARGMIRARKLAAARRRAAERLVGGLTAARGDPLGGHKRG